MALSGSTAGAFAGFIVTPFDVIKTRLMTHDIRQSQMSTWEAAKVVYSESGLPGLYRGATIRMGYLCVGGFAFFGVYEQIRKAASFK